MRESSQECSFKKDCPKLNLRIFEASNRQFKAFLMWTSQKGSDG
ncbi:7024_t:CDS:1, partial [Gigaspora margarita]